MLYLILTKTRLLKEHPLTLIKLVFMETFLIVAILTNIATAIDKYETPVETPSYEQCIKDMSAFFGEDSKKIKEVCDKLLNIKERNEN